MSSAFCHTFTLKKTGILPGLTYHQIRLNHLFEGVYIHSVLVAGFPFGLGTFYAKETATDMKVNVEKLEQHENTNRKYMKNLTQIIPALVTSTALVAGLAGPSATANEFTGSIAFSAGGVTTDNSILADATTFSLTGAFATTTTGEYTTMGVTNLTPVTFNGFKFNPPVGAVTPLWTFDVGSTVFSFDALSETATWNPGVNNGEWVILGSGIASISGFDDTPGEWTLNLSDSGNLSVGFDATAAATPSVPDGGGTLTLLGCAVTALGLYLRKFPC